MNKTYFCTCSLIFVAIISIASCSGQDEAKSNLSKEYPTSPQEIELKEANHPDFDQGVFCGFLDSQDILWFGSNGGGLYRVTLLVYGLTRFIPS